ncbi:tetratricopeptide repeat protein [Thalassotalea euphylliae]|uniref:tetratricopeptide repeat protein n=1 Tax=Thalassotalea euphylliae TaxID=1655234 RepID=UPI00364598BE
MKLSMKNYLLALISGVMICGYASASTQPEKIDKCMEEKCVNYFKQYKKAAKRGHPLAMLTLGQFYLHGYGTKANSKVALKYFKKAARHGYTAAQFKAGYIYMTDKELRDIEESIKYLERAATYDYKGANFVLGMLYFDEKYNSRDLAKADAYFEKSYMKKYEQMPTVVKYIEQQMPINQQNFPKLYAAMNATPLEKHKDGSLSWHADGIEVITITSPPLEQTFHKQLMDFRKAIKSTGTRFLGKTCAERLTCMQRADIADATDFRIFYIDGFSGAKAGE